MFKIKDEIKILRVILDENKTFKQHIKELCRKLFLLSANVNLFLVAEQEKNLFDQRTGATLWSDKHCQAVFKEC